MGFSPTVPTSRLLSSMTTSDLDRSFSRETLRRAHAYADAGQVEHLEIDDDAEGLATVSAVVVGGDTYEVDVTLADIGAGRVLVASDCDCPVGDQCKHGAAALLAARTLLVSREPTGAIRAVPDVPAWGRVLDDALGMPGGRVGDLEPCPLALQVELQLPHARPAWWGSGVAMQPSVVVRPLRRGARASWVKGGAGWSDMRALQGDPTYDPRQAAVLAAMADLAPPYPFGNGGIRLGDLGPGVWPLLNRAIRSGIPLVPAGPLESVAVEATGAVDLDVRASGDGTVLRPVLRGHEDAPPDSRLLVQGTHAHGVVLLTPVARPVERRAGQPGERFAAVLAPLEHGLDPGMRRLVGGTEPVVVPPADADRLAREYLPRLARQAQLISGDGSVELPEPPRPSLVLTVTWQAAGRIDLDWAWAYEGCPGPVALDSAEGRRAWRDREAEEALLAGLDLDGPARALLCDASGELVASQRLGDAQVLELTGGVLAALREHPSIEVVDRGTPPDYRPATQDPEVRFELAEEPAGAADAESTSTDWLDLDVQIHVDDERVPLVTVLEVLTRGERHLFLPSGLHVRTDHPALARLAEAVRAAGELVGGPHSPAEGADGAHLGEEPGETGNRLRVGRHDLGSWAELADIGAVDARAAHWVRAARALRDLVELPEAEPAGVSSELRSYQLAGFRWLAFLWESGLGGILADDMGLGKTLQTLALIGHARSRGAGTFLVVAPTSVVAAWTSEAERHAPGLRVRAVTGARRRRGTTIAEEAAGADVVVTSYTLLRLEAEEYADLPWGGLVLDEAQQVKNHQSKTHQAVQRVEAPFRLALTGTPFENRLMELWALLSLVAPGLYPRARTFAEQVATPVEKHGDTAALERFRRRIRPFLLRRTKELVARDLPAKQEQVLEVSLGTRHRKIYDSRLQRERQQILGLVEEDFEKHRITILSALTRLRQLSLDPALVDPAHEGVGSGKIDALVEHVVELRAEGHRALVFSQFTGFLQRVRARLDAEGIDSCYLDGTTRDRPEVIRSFRDGLAPVFLISLKAGGVGLTLTEADYVFVLDPWWNPATEAQAVDRAHRIGQTRPVLVYRLVATDTIEEKVMALKARKAALFDQVVDGDGALGAAVTADDVRALLSG